MLAKGRIEIYQHARPNSVPKMDWEKLETDFMPDRISIPLPAMKRLWRVRFADSIEVPKVSSTILLRGAATVFDAATKAKNTEGWKAFQNRYEDAAVVAVEYAGELEG